VRNSAYANLLLTNILRAHLTTLIYTKIFLIIGKK
jgi:hypothetical protein